MRQTTLKPYISIAHMNLSVAGMAVRRIAPAFEGAGFDVMQAVPGAVAQNTHPANYFWDNRLRLS